jgi:predicted Zn-dependent peptidase
MLRTMSTPLPLPPIAAEIRELPNGVCAVALPMPETATTLVAADVRVGARYESARDAGLSHFLEHMVFQGCAAHPTAQEVNEAAERMGTALDAYTSRDSTHFEQQVSPEYAGDAIRLLAAVLGTPAFHDIESERSIILEEALDEVDERGRLVDGDTLSRQVLWPDSPLGQSVVGNPRNLERFDAGDLRRHHGHHYVSGNLVVTAAGPHSGGGAARLAAARRSRRFTPGPEVAALPPHVAAPAKPGFVHVDDARSQVDCRRGLPDARRGLDAHAQRRWPWRGCASTTDWRAGCIGGWAVSWASPTTSGRTWERYPDVGAFEIGAQVSAAKVPTFFAEAFAPFRGRWSTTRRAGEELARMRFRARFHLRSTLERAEGRVLLVAAQRLYPAEPPSVDERLARLDAVTPEAISAAVEAILAGPAIGVAVGQLGRTARERIKDVVKDPGRPKPTRRS